MASDFPTPAEEKYLKVCAELETRGLPHQHRIAARLGGWRTPAYSFQLFERLEAKGFVVKTNEVKVKLFGRTVVIDAGPKLTALAWDFLDERKAA